MGLDFGLQMQQEQKLVMTQELQLSVKLLGMNCEELFEFVEGQITENPLLEYGETPEPAELQPTEQQPDELLDLYIEHAEEYGELERDRDQEPFEERLSPLYYVSEKQDLWDFLLEQLEFSPVNGLEARIGEYLIRNIDEEGYLKIELSEVAAHFHCEEEFALKALMLVQEFDPSGVGARTLMECLTLQLRRRSVTDPILFDMLKNHLSEVGKGDIGFLTKHYNLEPGAAKAYTEQIKSLNPRPGLVYCTEAPLYVQPDVSVEWDGAEFNVIVRDERMPRLMINRTYRNLLSNKDSEAYQYVRERLQRALWLIKSIEQRRETILRVTEAIVDYQSDYFYDRGELRPMALRQIADKIEMHESTVSRTVNGKYALTPNGVFELKSFFLRGIVNDSGEDISTASIKSCIKQLVEGENADKPYSDAALEALLQSRGMNIKRRTVAKYREELGIPTSSKRKSKG